MVVRTWKGTVRTEDAGPPGRRHPADDRQRLRQHGRRDRVCRRGRVHLALLPEEDRYLVARDEQAEQREVVDAPEG